MTRRVQKFCRTAGTKTSKRKWYQPIRDPFKHSLANFIEYICISSNVQFVYVTGIFFFFFFFFKGTNNPNKHENVEKIKLFYRKNWVNIFTYFQNFQPKCLDFGQKRLILHNLVKLKKKKKKKKERKKERNINTKQNNNKKNSKMENLGRLGA